MEQLRQGEPCAAEQLLPLVYDELRRLAAERMLHERPGQTLQATALVHEAYLRLVDKENLQRWDNRRHFFAAAAEAMRRILVESARRKSAEKHGGKLNRQDVSPEALFAHDGRDPVEVSAVHEALERFAEKSPRKAELVKLRYFLGCTIPEAAEILGIAPATAEDDWTYAKAWLRRQLGREQDQKPEP
jgi:RNA polymerase sigma factor (TIGR02999 family)